MEQCQMKGCNCPGQKHHIVYRSHGGLDIRMNYKYLCVNHHTDGKEAVHNNRAVDLMLKKELQDRYFEEFDKEEYTVKEISEIIGYDRNRLQKKMKTVRQRAGKYQKEDVVRFLMGGKLY